MDTSAGESSRIGKRQEWDAVGENRRDRKRTRLYIGVQLLYSKNKQKCGSCHVGDPQFRFSFDIAGDQKTEIYVKKILK